MKLLLINQFFWPDVAPTGQLLTDLARHLAANHEVTVICSGGSYADAATTSNPPPVRIIRIPGWRYRRGVMARFASYSTFLAGVLWQEFVMNRPDLVLTMTTPPLLGWAGTILKRLRGVRHYIWEMDVFPDVLVSLGALRERSYLTRILRYLENTCRRQSDGVIAIGPCMRNRLLQRGVPEELVSVAENWTDGDLITPEPPRRSGPLHVLYSGNLGVSHDIETIVGAIRHFRNDPRFLFLFAGGGEGKGRVGRICVAENMTNVRFLPYSSREAMSGHLAQADVGLVTEHPASLRTVVPSKTYGLMAAARPILFIGPRKATPALVIERYGCGWQVEPGDVDSLVQLLEWLATHRELLEIHGRRGRECFEKHHNLPAGVARIAAILRVEGQQEKPSRFAAATF